MGKQGLSVWMAVCYVGLLVTPAQATVNQSMQDWFNDIGAYGNVTGPNAYRGQTMNLYTGGSLYMRTPVRNYQLASIAPPSFTAGCGGIDLFAGSFSFINKEQFVALLRNIGNNAIGAAFKTFARLYPASNFNVCQLAHVAPGICICLCTQKPQRKIA